LSAFYPLFSIILEKHPSGLRLPPERLIQAIMATLTECYQVNPPIVCGISVYMVSSQNHVAACYDLGRILGAFAELAFPGGALPRQ
jgi:hypothetical protein